MVTSFKRRRGPWSALLFATVFLGSAAAVFPAEKIFDFSQYGEGQTPTGFVSTVTGAGHPGAWKIVQDEVPSSFAPLSEKAPVQKRPVLAQLSQDPADEHFPLFIFEGEDFGDFSLSTKFKCVRGTVEKMAGIAFRWRDASNYYVLRASAEGNNLRFYKFVDGQRSPPLGPDVEVAKGMWHDLKITCHGTEIRASLDGREFPVWNDPTFARGRVGFWTKSDSVSYFVDTRLTYVPRIGLAQAVVGQVMQDFPRLLGVKIYARPFSGNAPNLQVVGASDQSSLGQPAPVAVQNILERDEVHYQKEKGVVAVTVPLRDKNGENYGGLTVSMKSFPGQTDRNAIARIIPIKQAVEKRIGSPKDLFE